MSVCTPQSFAGLYNIPQPWTPGYAAMDVLHASRTLVWLKGEEVLVTYDRATTVHSGKFKRWNMNFIATPAVAGNVVTAAGKVNKVQVTSLLPANRNITVQVGVFRRGAGSAMRKMDRGCERFVDASIACSCLPAWCVDVSLVLQAVNSMHSMLCVRERALAGLQLTILPMPTANAAAVAAVFCVTPCSPSLFGRTLLSLSPPPT